MILLRFGSGRLLGTIGTKAHYFLNCSKTISSTTTLSGRSMFSSVGRLGFETRASAATRAAAMRVRGQHASCMNLPADQCCPPRAVPIPPCRRCLHRQPDGSRGLGLHVGAASGRRPNVEKCSCIRNAFFAYDRSGSAPEKPVRRTSGDSRPLADFSSARPTANPKIRSGGTAYPGGI